MSDRQHQIERFKDSWRKQTAAQAANPPSLEQFRTNFDDFHGAIPIPEGCVVQRFQEQGVSGEHITPLDADSSKILLYHHGGGYTFGSVESHRHMVARIAEAAGVAALNMHYRLAPENPYPAALEDALANYRYALERYSPSSIVLGGESAGGGLTCALLLKIMEEDLPLPAGAYLLSPWVDLTQSGDSYETCSERDPMITRLALENSAMAYVAEGDAEHPLISPLFSELEGFPPLLIQVGADEVLLSDSLNLASKAALAGVDVTLRVWPQMVHAWLLFHQALPSDGAAGFQEAGRWINERLTL